MEQTVLVKRVLEDGSAEVLRVRESACSGDCHKCSGCGSSQQTMVIPAENPIGAKVGDWVVIEAKSGAVLKAAAMLYIVPLVLFIAGYLLGMQWGLGGLVGGLAFFCSIGLVIAYDRLVMKKKNTEYTITGFSRKSQSPNG